MKRFLAGMLCMALVVLFLFGIFGSHLLLRQQEREGALRHGYETLLAQTAPSISHRDVQAITLIYDTTETSASPEQIAGLMRLYNEVIAAEPLVLADTKSGRIPTMTGGTYPGLCMKTEDGTLRLGLSPYMPTYHYESAYQFTADTILANPVQESYHTIVRESIMPWLAELRSAAVPSLYVSLLEGVVAIYPLTEEQVARFAEYFDEWDGTLR